MKKSYWLWIIVAGLVRDINARQRVQVCLTLPLKIKLHDGTHRQITLKRCVMRAWGVGSLSLKPEARPDVGAAASNKAVLSSFNVGNSMELFVQTRTAFSLVASCSCDPVSGTVVVWNVGSNDQSHPQLQKKLNVQCLKSASLCFSYLAPVQFVDPRLRSYQSDLKGVRTDNIIHLQSKEMRIIRLWR